MTLGSEQLNELIGMVQGLLGGVMGADGKGGPIKSLREMGAATDFLKDAVEQFKDFPLIGQIIEGLLGKIGGGDDDGEPMEASDALGKLGMIDDLLGEQAGKFKEFIFGFVEKVAGASGGGLFGSGQKISEGEQGFLDDLKGKLGL